MLSAGALRRLDHMKTARPVRRAAPMKDPATMPPIAPFDNPSETSKLMLRGAAQMSCHPARFSIDHLSEC